MDGWSDPAAKPIIVFTGLEVLAGNGNGTGLRKTKHKYFVEILKPTTSSQYFYLRQTQSHYVCLLVDISIHCACLSPMAIRSHYP
jgi:hypothetical protein